jgi:hypothetical protein
MYLIKINGKDLRYPETASDIKVMQYIDFIKEHSKFNNEMSIYETTLQLGQCLSAFFGIDILEFKDIDSGIDDLNKYIKGSDEIIKLNSIVGYVSGIAKIITDYVPATQTESLNFTYKGKEWNIPQFKVSEFSDEFLRPQLKYGTVIKIVESKRVASKIVGKDEKGNDKDPTGSNQLTELLYVVSYLATNDEIDPTIRDINERIQYFKDIDMKSALDIFFFLTSTSIAYQKIHDLNIFSILQNR